MGTPLYQNLPKHKSFEQLEALLESRIVLLDGPKGTMIQAMGLTEIDFHGEIFATHPSTLKGNNDILNLTRPDIVKLIHQQHVDAGADIIGTNTFNANRISQADYRTEAFVYQINVAGARIAKEVASAANRPIFVAGTIGPTNKSASIATDPQRPHQRSVTFKELVEAYKEQILGLVDGGVDLLLIETIFDSLNAKAAAFAATEVFSERGLQLPLCFSVTVSDKSGRLLNGQTLKAFWYAIQHTEPFAIGLNCGMGPDQMRPFLQELSNIVPCYTMCYPNAGLPDITGRYTLDPEQMAHTLSEYAKEGLLNIVGGCCGSTPAHIKAISEAVKNLSPRPKPISPQTRLTLSGLEPLELIEGQFVNIGERTNVAGSAQFARLIKSGDYEGALRIARQQVENGAQIIDVCVDDPMIDSARVMQEFLHTALSDPAVAKVPVMIDSSSWNVIESGLQCLPGKGIVNSISLKDGPEEFLRRAKLIQRYGAAIVVMAMDEHGQAETFERKIQIIKRAYELLTSAGVLPQNIIFDPNVFAVGTGDEKQKHYAADFIRAVKWIKDHLPLCATSGGISNVSYAFKGNNAVRHAMNSVFLYHAIKAGLDMGIVNAGQIQIYDDIPAQLRELIEDVLFARKPDAVDQLLEYARNLPTIQKDKQETVHPSENWRQGSIESRLEYAIMHAITEYLETDLQEALQHYKDPISIIEGPLMSAMNRVGDLFANGKMFLPQVVKAARAMRHAVTILESHLQAKHSSNYTRRGKIVLATVKGDVHDIGKNIVATVLKCNGFEVIDLGIMVPADQIAQAVKQYHADMVGLSGLITPSLEEMAKTAEELVRNQIDVPLLIGGAATSKLYTAIKIAPRYKGPVVHVPDASKAVPVANSLLDPNERQTFWNRIRSEYQSLQEQFFSRFGRKCIPIQDARARPAKITQPNFTSPKWHGLAILGTPAHIQKISSASVHVPVGTLIIKITLSDLIPYLNWTAFLNAWELQGSYPAILEDPSVGLEAQRLYSDAQALLQQMAHQNLLHPAGVIGVFPAIVNHEEITIPPSNGWPQQPLKLHFFREQGPKSDSEPCPCLTDFLPRDNSGTYAYVGAFALTAGHGLSQLIETYATQNDTYLSLMAEVLSDRLAEAFSEFAHRLVTALWLGIPFDPLSKLQNLKPIGIRPAAGYPIWPDHSEKDTLWKLLSVKQLAGIELTETFMMIPASSVCGLYIIHPAAHYFNINAIGQDQLTEYCTRSGKKKEAVVRFIQPFMIS